MKRSIVQLIRIARLSLISACTQSASANQMNQQNQQQGDYLNLLRYQFYLVPISWQPKGSWHSVVDTTGNGW